MTHDQYRISLDVNKLLSKIDHTNTHFYPDCFKIENEHLYLYTSTFKGKIMTSHSKLKLDLNLYSIYGNCAYLIKDHL